MWIFDLEHPYVFQDKDVVISPAPAQITLIR